MCVRIMEKITTKITIEKKRKRTTYYKKNRANPSPDGYIYIIEEEDSAGYSPIINRYFKIGACYKNLPKVRLQNIQVGNPRKLRFKYLLQVRGNPTCYEKFAHNLKNLNFTRGLGEWFFTDQNTIDKVIQKIKNYQSLKDFMDDF